MEFKTREYIESDREDLISCLRALRQTLIPLNPDRKKVISEQFFDLYMAKILSGVETGETRIIVAESQGKIIGYAHGVLNRISELDQLQFESKLSGEVIDLYVDPRYRKQGIASHLLSEVSAFFKKKGCSTMSLIVLENNAEAIEYYSSQGFVIEAREMVKKI